MTFSRPTHARMTRDHFAGSASSGLPLALPKAAPCVLDQLVLARPRAHAGRGKAILG
jgi:hypothetical protein